MANFRYSKDNPKKKFSVKCDFELEARDLDEVYEKIINLAQSKSLEITVTKKEESIEVSI